MRSSDRRIECRASTVLIAGKMLIHLAQYGRPETSEPMRRIAGELMQNVVDQMTLEEIEQAVAEAQKREGASCA